MENEDYRDLLRKKLAELKKPKKIPAPKWTTAVPDKRNKEVKTQ